VKAWEYARVERLYHAALELPRQRRHAFLADACSGDEALRREVDSWEQLGDTIAVDLARSNGVAVQRLDLRAESLQHLQRPDGNVLDLLLGQFPRARYRAR
jgi:hypothetical protein